MNKSDLVEALARSRKLPRRTAEEVVNVVFNTMRDTLRDGGRIEVRGFGTFKVREYKGYTGRNPKTGQEVQIAPKRLPVFKLSKVLRARLNQGLEEG